MYKRGDVVEISASDFYLTGSRGVVTGHCTEEGESLVKVRVCGEHMPFGDHELSEARPNQHVGTFPFLDPGKGRV